MKHPRLFLWYPVAVLIFVIFFVFNIVEGVMMWFIAGFSVLEVICFRFELWAKYNDPHQLFNDPYKRTLKQIFVDTLKGKRYG